MEAVVFALGFAAIALLAFLAFKHFDKRLTFFFGLLFAAYCEQQPCMPAACADGTGAADVSSRCIAARQCNIAHYGLLVE